jgi:hypothetical protein
MDPPPEIESDYFISLSSKDDLDRFSGNSNVDFINYMDNEVRFDPDKCRIGLAHLTFNVDKIDSPPVQARVTETPVDTIQFFGKAPNDNLITIWTNLPTTFTIRNQGRNVKELFAKLSEEFKLVKAPVELYLLMSPDKNIRVKLIFTDPAGRELIIPRKLAEVLGFQKVTFISGEHIAGNEMNNVRFLELLKDEIFNFQISNWKEMKLPMDEPVTQHLDDVAFGVTMALRAGGRLREVAAASEDGMFVLTFHRANIKLALPAEVNRYLKLSEDYVFSDAVTQIKITEAPTVTIEEPTIEVTTTSPSKSVFVLCDAIQSHRVGKSFEPVLRMLIKPSNTECSLDFNPVFYMKPRGEELRHIRFRLVDKNFNSLNKTDTETVAILHVKTLSS